MSFAEVLQELSALTFEQRQELIRRAVELDDPPLSEADATELARGFAALADPARLRVLSLLASAEAGEVCACDLVGPVGRSQPTVSHHLKVLLNAGLLERERRGSWVYYRVIPEALQHLSHLLGADSMIVAR